MLNFDATPMGGINVGVNASIPGVCQTAAHLAGANEIAIVSVDVTYLSAIPSTLFMWPLVNQGGGGAAFAGSFAAGPITANAWGSLHNQAQVVLTPNVSYRFFAGVSAGVALPLNNFTCRGLVTIVKKP